MRSGRGERMQQQTADQEGRCGRVAFHDSALRFCHPCPRRALQRRESARRRTGYMRRRDSQGARGWVAKHEGQR